MVLKMVKKLKQCGVKRGKTKNLRCISGKIKPNYISGDHSEIKYGEGEGGRNETLVMSNKKRKQIEINQRTIHNPGIQEL